MKLDLMDGQDLLLDTTKRLLTASWSTQTIRSRHDVGDRSDRAISSRGADLGWTALMVPDELGGGSVSGHAVSDLALLVEELGRVLFSGPVVSTNLAAFALAASGSTHLAEEHLPGVVSGTSLIAWAVPEEGTRWGADATGITATPSAGGFVLRGVKWPIQDAEYADHLLVSAMTPDGLTQFLVPADVSGVTVGPMESIDLARRLAFIEFDSVQVPATAVVGAVGEAEEAVERQLALALTLQCAETVGATDAAFDMALTYVKDRKAFGRAIGSYQALKHRFADMLLWLEGAKAVTEAAVDALERGTGESDSACMAKAYVASKCPLIVRDCLQMFGGIGFTWEHDVHLYLRRVESNALLYGDRDYHLDRLAPGIGL